MLDIIKFFQIENVRWAFHACNRGSNPRGDANVEIKRGKFSSFPLFS